MPRLISTLAMACLPLLTAGWCAASPAVAKQEAPVSVHDVPVGARKIVIHRFDRKTADGGEHYFVVFENGRQVHAGTSAELRRVPDPAVNFALSGVLSQIAVPRRDGR